VTAPGISFQCQAILLCSSLSFRLSISPESKFPVESAAIFASRGSNNKLRHEVRSVEAALPQTNEIQHENASEQDDRHDDPMVD